MSLTLFNSPTQDPAKQLQSIMLPPTCFTVGATHWAMYKNPVWWTKDSGFDSSVHDSIFQSSVVLWFQDPGRPFLSFSDLLAVLLSVAYCCISSHQTCNSKSSFYTWNWDLQWSLLNCAWSCGPVSCSLRNVSPDSLVARVAVLPDRSLPKFSSFWWPFYGEGDCTLWHVDSFFTLSL